MTSTRIKLKIGTRESILARLQTDLVLAQLRSAAPELEFEIVAEKTSGDKVLNKPIAELGSTGVFVKELEDALLSGRVDLVVHSLKDLPTDVPDGLRLGAVLLRDDPRDVFVSSSNKKFQDMPAGSRIATSSRRRACQLAALRSDLQFVDVRGNIQTRLRKLDEGQCEGMVLAAAGLLRLDYNPRITQFFEPGESIPAAGQGALGVECRTNDDFVTTLLVKINDPNVAAETAAERSFLKRLGGGCSIPIGVLGRLQPDGTVLLQACVADGTSIMRESLSGTTSGAEALGVSLAEKMLAAGADRILSNVMQRPQQTISPP